ncbi:hypothetical protein DPMN_105560 [Dreissena polymorpha]|uniref:Uncharacterized protein n=1 Tax=Dreissena polymorpha TaxID=45954 RepID=A0A9D4K3F5_DREPO|nr:hypothetical protein DPMN_105560 [Dreissena polymorpha]
MFFHQSGPFSNWSKIVTSRVFTRKTAPPTGRHVFQRTGTTYELNQPIIKTNILQSYMKIGHETFQLDRDFIGTKLLAMFHYDRTINVASRVFTNKSHLTNQFAHLRGTNILVNSHVIQVRVKCPAHWRPYINTTNVLTNFHDSLAKTVTSRVFTREKCPSTGGHVFSPILTIFELVPDIN